MSDKTDWEAHVVGAKAAKESIAVVDLEWDRAVLYAADRIAELEADIELLWWDSIEAAVYKRKCVSLEAENKRLSLDRDDWMGRYNALYDNGPLHRLEAELEKLREAVGSLLNDNSPKNRDDVYALLEEME